MALYTRYRLRVFSLILRIVKDRELAEEILQDVFFRLWSRSEAFLEGKGQFSSWLLVVARNLALDRLRGQIRRGSGIVFSIDDSQMESALCEPDRDLQQSVAGGAATVAASATGSVGVDVLRGANTSGTGGAQRRTLRDRENTDQARYV